MPVERSWQSNSDLADAAHPTWTIPGEPASPPSIAFAPNVTPGTFNVPPSGNETSFEPVLFPSSLPECSARRPTHSKKRGEDHIPRPPNAFILFRSSFIKSQHVSTEVETNHSTLSKIIGLTWQNMPHDERQKWHAKAKKALEDHKKRWPQYSFRPSHSKSKRGAEKRKVREVEPKDMKRCAKIAELLVEGKKGAELDAAIQEFDRTHVPEIVTRFETPITAGTYSRSSSAPIDNAQSQNPSISSLHHRVRSASSQPFTRPLGKPKTPAALTSSQSCPDLSDPNPSVPSLEYSFPSRSQPSYELDEFTFGVAFGDSILPTSTELGTYPVTGGRVQTPILCIDTTCHSDWTPTSSPFSSSPATPQLLSPSPIYECALDEDPFALNPFSAALDQIPPYGPSYSPAFTMFNRENPPLNGAVFTSPDFTTFSKDPFAFGGSSRSVHSVDTNSPMSAFLSALSAF